MDEKNADTAECGVVPIRDTGTRALAEELQAMETAAEDPVGGSAEEDGKREEPFHDPRPSGG